MTSRDYLYQAQELLRKAQVEATIEENDRELGLIISDIRNQVLEIKGVN